MTTLSGTQEKAFTFAQDLIKQVISLSSGIIALTITFFKDFVGNSAPHHAKMLLAVSWLFYIGSVFFGIWALMALTGSLGDGKTSIKDTNMRLPAKIHFGCFIVGLGITVAAGWQAL